jgi:hypothetical protein
MLRNANLVSWDGVRIKTTDGCLLTFWEDTLGGSKRIMAMKFDSFGQALWNAPSCVAEGIDEPIAYSAVETSDAGYALLFGEQLSQDFSVIRTQKLDSSGAALWGDGGIAVCTQPGYITTGTPVADNAGGIYLYWSNFASANIIRGQHIDAAGNHLWQVNGLVVMQHSGDQHLLDAVSDGAGGSIINASRTPDGSAPECHLLRLSPAGTVVGNDPLMPPSNFPGSMFRLMKSASGAFLLYDSFYSPALKLLAIDNTGTVLGSLVSHPFPASYVASAGVTLLNVPSGGLYYIYRTDAPSLLQACLLDADLGQMWASPVTVTTVDSLEIWGLSHDTDAAGNLWSVWTASDSSVPMYEVRAQLVSPSGQLMWTSDGKWLASSDRHVDNTFVSTAGERGTFIWTMIQDDLRTLRRQTVSPDGTCQFNSGGMPIVSCLAGFAGAEAVVPIGSGFCALWSDTRGSDLGQLYYQILDQAMSPVLQPNGISLCADMGISERIVSAVPMPDGSVAVLFTYFADFQSVGDLLLQIIEPDGSNGLPLPGLTIAPNVGSTEASMGLANGDLYIAWLDYEYVGGDPVAKILGQRVHQGVLEWGGGGRLIHQRSQCGVWDVAVNADYIMIEYQDFSSDGNNARVFRVLPNGSPAPGWPSFGHELVSTPSNWISLANFRGGIADNDLVCVFRRNSTTRNGLFAQRFTASGNRAWGSNGVQLDSDQYSRVSCADFSSEVSFGIIRMGSTALWLQRFTPAGNPILGDQGAMINIPGNDYDDVLIRYPDHWYSFFRVGISVNGDNVIQHQFISSAGDQQFAQPEVICEADFGRSNLHGTRQNNSTCLIWTDDRKGIYDYENMISSVYGVRVTSNHTDNPVPDAVLPAVPKLTNVCPNPFNPSTTISFCLPQAGEVDLAIYNIRGQQVACLCDGIRLPAGEHSTLWNGRDEKGKPVASGIYLCVLRTAGGMAQRKMVLSK